MAALTNRVCLIALTMMLAACDKPAEDKNAQAEGQEVAVVEAASGEPGSTSPASPGGSDVTEQEIPGSDVPPPSRDVFKDSTCDFEVWVGQPVDEAAVKETGRVYRILPPNSMMTMDHNPDRINVEHDDAKTVTRVWCG